MVKMITVLGIEVVLLALLSMIFYLIVKGKSGMKDLFQKKEIKLWVLMVVIIAVFLFIPMDAAITLILKIGILGLLINYIYIVNIIYNNANPSAKGAILFAVFGVLVVTGVDLYFANIKQSDMISSHEIIEYEYRQNIDLANFPKGERLFYYIQNDENQEVKVYTFENNKIEEYNLLLSDPNFYYISKEKANRFMIIKTYYDNVNYNTVPPTVIKKNVFTKMEYELDRTVFR